MAQGDYPVGRTLPENAVPARYAPSAWLTPHTACQFLRTRYQQFRRHRGCYAAQDIADACRSGGVAKVPFCSHTHYRMRHRSTPKHTVGPDVLGGDNNRKTWKFKRLALVISSRISSSRCRGVPAGTLTQTTPFFHRAVMLREAARTVILTLPSR